MSSVREGVFVVAHTPLCALPLARANPRLGQGRNAMYAGPQQNTHSKAGATGLRGHGGGATDVSESARGALRMVARGVSG